MKFFDSLIKQALDITRGLAEIDYEYNADKLWKDAGCNQVILQKHSAFELKGTGFNLVTSSPVEDGVTVIGDELCSIKKDCRFTRISIVQIDEQEDEQVAQHRGQVHAQEEGEEHALLLWPDGEPQEEELGHAALVLHGHQREGISRES